MLRYRKFTLNKANNTKTGNGKNQPIKERKPIPRSHVQRDIIRFLDSKEELTFTDMQRILSISRKTLSHHISELKKENSIEYEKRGREKYYRISRGISEISKRQGIIFANNYLDHLVEDPRIKNDYERLYESAERKLVTYFSFGIIKSIQKGENMFEGFDVDVLLYMMASSIHSKAIKDGNDSEALDELDSMNWEQFFKKIKKVSEMRANKKGISDAYGELARRYPDEVRELEEIMSR